MLYNPKECRGEKVKVCPFFLPEYPRPLSPWGSLDFLSTRLGNDSLNVCHGPRFLCHTRLRAPKIDVSGFKNQTSSCTFCSFCLHTFLSSAWVTLSIGNQLNFYCQKPLSSLCLLLLFLFLESCLSTSSYHSL